MSRATAHQQHPAQHINYGVVVAVVTAAMSFAFSWGVQGNRIETLEKEVTRYQVDSRAQETSLTRITATLERIDERLNYITARPANSPGSVRVAR